MTSNTETPTFKPKKSVALSGTAAGNTALCTVGRSGNDLHYRGYDILDVATTCEFEEIAHLLVHGKLPTIAELTGYKAKLKALRGLPASHVPVVRGIERGAHAGRARHEPGARFHLRLDCTSCLSHSSNCGPAVVVVNAYSYQYS